MEKVSTKVIHDEVLSIYAKYISQMIGCYSPLESFSENIREKLYNKIKDGEFEIDPSYQG
jgi:hypothetical protein